VQKKTRFFFVIPFLVCILLTGLSFLAGYQWLEQKVYDFFLLLTAVDTENKQILLLEADPVTYSAAYKNDLTDTDTHTIPRRALAAGLILLKEFDARYAVISQEFDTESMYQRTPRQLVEDLKALLYAISLEPEERDLAEHLHKIYADDDAYLAQAARFFGNTFLGMKTRKIAASRLAGEAPQDTIQSAQISLRNLEVIQDTLPVTDVIQPVVFPLLSGAKGTGLINYTADRDGLIRRVALIQKNNNYYIPELGFAALLDWLGQPKVVLLANQLILKNARCPGQGVKDITIPLTAAGRFFIQWSEQETLATWRRRALGEFFKN
jgi:adenylate cyclase